MSRPIALTECPAAKQMRANGIRFMTVYNASSTHT